MFRAFDAVTVRLSLDTSNVQHEKLVLQLVQPYIEGFSVRPLADDDSGATVATANVEQPKAAAVAATAARKAPTTPASKKDGAKKKRNK